MSAPDVTMVGAAAWDEARRCLPVIRRLAENPARTRGDVVAGAAEIGCGPTHAYALLRRYLADPRLTSLLPRARGPERGVSLLDPDVDALIAEAIDSVYLTRQQARLIDLVTEVRHRCMAAGLARPNREVTAKREGRKAARDRYVPVVGSTAARS